MTAAGVAALEPDVLVAETVRTARRVATLSTSVALHVLLMVTWFGL